MWFCVPLQVEREVATANGRRGNEAIHVWKEEEAVAALWGTLAANSAASIQSLLAGSTTISPQNISHPDISPHGVPRI